MNYYPKLLLIAGNGSNVGKTTLACKIINDNSNYLDIIALKISPHIHTKTEKSKVLIDSCNFALVEELDRESKKDSSKMLKAGAVKSFYFQVHDAGMKDALPFIKRYVDFNSIIVCESGWLRHYYRPGLFLMVNRPDKPVNKKRIKQLMQYADLKINFDGIGFDYDLKNIIFSGNEWKYI